jgi:serine/threonine protein kinase/tetratricopeptide (TPR) repeat protein
MTRLHTAPTDASASLRLANLVEEVSRRLQNGEAVSLEEYASDYPDCMAALRDLWPGLKTLAQMGRSIETDDAATLPGGFGEVIGDKLGDYRIVRELGRGGMGIVYEAEQLPLGRRVAVKVLPHSAMMDKQRLQRFQNEACAAASLSHNHIVPIFSVNFDGRLHFYAMQLITGQTVNEVISRVSYQLECLRKNRGIAAKASDTTVVLKAGEDGETDSTAETDHSLHLPWLPSDERQWTLKAARWVMQVAEAIEHAHQMGVVHRDIKPSNLMVDQAGKIWVTDFGLAHLESNPGLTATGAVLGTLRYLSPERARGEHRTSVHLSDVYALGLTLYEMLALRAAFPTQDRQQLLRQLIDEEPTPLRQLQPGVPRDLALVVEKAIAKIPAERYLSAAAMADDLQRFLNGEPVLVRAPTILQKAVRRVRKHPRLTAVLGSVLALFIIGSLFGTLAYSQHLSTLALRREKINRQVAELLLFVDQSRERARSGVPDATLHWARAREAASRIETIATAGLVEPEFITQINALGNELEKEEKDRRLLLELDAAAMLVFNQPAVATGSMPRTPIPFFNELASRDATVEAFANWGIGPKLQAADHAAEKLRERGSEFLKGVIPFLNQWARHELSLQAPERRTEIALWVNELLDCIDSNPWRQRLRTLSNSDDAEAIMTLAAEPEASEQPPYALVWLAYLLRKHNRPLDAQLLLKDACLRHPDSFWLHFDRAWNLMAIYSPENPADFVYSDAKQEALHHMLVANALRPQFTPLLRHLEAELVNDKRLHEAQIIMLQLAKMAPVDPRIARGDPKYGNPNGLRRRFEEERVSFCNPAHFKPENRYPYLVRPQRAASALDNAVAVSTQLQPGDVDYARGMELIEQGLTDEAKEVMSELTHREPDHANAASALGYLYLCSAEVDKATVLLKRVTELQADDAVAQVNLAAAYLEKGDLRRATHAARTAIRLKPQLAEGYFCLADACGRESRWREAIELFKHGLQYDPMNAVGWYQLATAGYFIGDKTTAITAYEKVIEMGNVSLEIYTRLVTVMEPPAGVKIEGATAVEARRQTNLKRISVLEQAMQIYPENAGILATAATICSYQMQDWETAARYYQRTIELEPDGVGKQLTLTRLADVTRELKDPKWVDTFRILLERTPVTTSGALGIDVLLAKALFAFGEEEAGLTRVRRVLEIDPKCFAGHHELGQMMAARGDYSEALVAYRQALSHGNDDALYKNNLAWLLATCEDMSIRNIQEAVELASSATRQRPQDAACWNTLGVAHYRSGNWDDAKQALEQSMELTSGESCCDWLFLAMIHMRLGDKEQAVSWYAKAVEWMKATASEDKELIRFRDEAKSTLGLETDPQNATE